MGKPAIGYGATRHAANVNGQVVEIAAAATLVEADANKVYFLTRIEGSGSTIKDAAGNTIITTVNDTTDWVHPGLRLDAGFSIVNGSVTVNELHFYHVHVM